MIFARPNILTARPHYAVTLWPRIIGEIIHKLVSVCFLERNHLISSYHMLSSQNMTKESVRVLYRLSSHTPRASTNHIPAFSRSRQVLSDTYTRLPLQVDLAHGFFHLPVQAHVDQPFPRCPTNRTFPNMGITLNGFSNHSCYDVNCNGSCSANVGKFIFSYGQDVRKKCYVSVA